MLRLTFQHTRQAYNACAQYSSNFIAKRLLNIHEYQGIALMNKFGVKTPRAIAASTPEEAEKAALSLIDEKDSDVVIKAQALTGGRGLGSLSSGLKGGVHMCDSSKHARDLASKMLGHLIFTKQTGESGRPVNKVMLMERVYMRREMYISIMMDRKSGGPIIVASSKGGTSIEDIAASTPELIFKVPVNIESGLLDHQVEKLTSDMGFTGHSIAEAISQIKNLYNLFISTDATLVEVNPLALTPDGKVLVCDAKLNFDDNAAYRQKEIFELRDTSQEDSREVEAAKYDLNYIGLDGNIGCLVNGAGLAMATMDIIKLYDGNPANFLDVGGGATERQVSKAFEILNEDKNVKAILVNIFGGIMRCDVIALGIINAVTEIGLRKPVVVRLEGTNVREARQLIEESGLRMVLTDNLEDAAMKAVRIADIVKQAEKVQVDVKFQLPLT